MNGYTIAIKDYKAEICECNVIQIINMPDNSKIYHISTKYGENYVKEGDVSPIKKVLEKQCEELNKALKKSEGTRGAKRNNQSHRW